MNVSNTLSRHHSAPLNDGPRLNATSRRGPSIRSQSKSRLQPTDAIQEQDRREVVAQRFMSMNEAHDRIRTRLLAAGR
jgi:hypothetical protein